jgi:hypothetical protein
MTYKLRVKLQRAFLYLLLPPAAVGGLYWYGSSTGCSGGDCTGAMMGIMFLGLLAVPVMLAGVLTLIDVALTLLGAWVRKRFGREPA